MGDIRRCKAADRGLRDGRVDEELVLRQGLGEFEVFFAAGGVEDLLGACLERCFELKSRQLRKSGKRLHSSYDRYYVCRLIVQSVCQLLVEGDEVGDVDVAVVLL